MLISESTLRKIVRGVISEMKDASYHNNKYIVSMLRDGYLAHGTTNGNLSSFDANFIKGGCRGEYGYGFYFTDELYKCLEYGTNIYFTPSNIYNFFDLDKNGGFNNILQEYDNLMDEKYRCEEKLDNVRNNREYNYYNEMLEEIKEKIRNSGNNKKIFDFISIAIRECKGYSDESVFKYILCNSPSGMDKELSSFLMSYGYDGVRCGNQYCIFNIEKLNANVVE